MVYDKKLLYTNREQTWEETVSLYVFSKVLYIENYVLTDMYGECTLYVDMYCKHQVNIVSQNKSPNDEYYVHVMQ